MATTQLYILLLLYIILIINKLSANAFCQWTVNDTSGNPHSLDLSCIADHVLKTQDTHSDSENKTIHDYLFSICANMTLCGDNGKVMVAQRDSNGDDNTPCFNVGIYDPSIQPQYENSLEGSFFIFEYFGGDCNNGVKRKWQPTFLCDKSVEADIGKVVETSYKSCNYIVTVLTKYACNDVNDHCIQHNSSSSSSITLSGGSIFIIILICGLFIYFVVGYIVMAFTVNKAGGFRDFKNNIPNKTLWINCIPLVIAGCMFTKDYIIGLMSKNRSDNKEERLTELRGNDVTPQ